MLTVNAKQSSCCLTAIVFAFGSAFGSVLGLIGQANAAPIRVVVVHDAPGAVYGSGRDSGDIRGVLDRFQTAKVIEENNDFLRVELPGWNGVDWDGWVPKKSATTPQLLEIPAILRWDACKAAEKQANALAAERKFAEAAASSKEASVGLNEVFGVKHPEAIRGQLAYATRLLDAEDFDQANRVISESIASMSEATPRDEDSLCSARLLLASMHERRGNPGAALKEYQNAYSDHAMKASRFRRVGKRWLNHGDTPGARDQAAEAIFQLLGKIPDPPQSPNATDWTGTEFRGFLYPHASPGDFAVVELAGTKLKAGALDLATLAKGDIRRILSVRSPWLLLAPPGVGNGKVGWVHREAVSLLPGGRQDETTAELTPPTPIEAFAVVDIDSAPLRLDGGIMAEATRGFSRALLAETAGDLIWIRVAHAGVLRYASLPAKACRRELPQANLPDVEPIDVFRKNGHGQPAMVRVAETVVRWNERVVARIGFGQEVAMVVFKGDEIQVECEDEDGRIVTGTVAARTLAPFAFQRQSFAFLARGITVGAEVVPCGLVRKIHEVTDGKLVVDTLRQPRLTLENPPLVPLTLGRVHFARLMQDAPGKAVPLEARGIFFGEIPPHLTEAVGISQPETLNAIAVQDLKESVEKQPRLPTAWLFLGVRLADERQFGPAEKAFTQSIRWNDRNSLAYFRRAIARTSAGDKPGAIQDYRKTLELDPQNRAAGLALFELTMLHGR